MNGCLFYIYFSHTSANNSVNYAISYKKSAITSNLQLESDTKVELSCIIYQFVLLVPIKNFKVNCLRTHIKIRRRRKKDIKNVNRCYMKNWLIQNGINENRQSVCVRTFTAAINTGTAQSPCSKTCRWNLYTNFTYYIYV